MRLDWQIQRATAFDMAIWSKAVASLLREVKARTGEDEEEEQDEASADENEHWHVHNSRATGSSTKLFWRGMQWPSLRVLSRGDIRLTVCRGPEVARDFTCGFSI